MKTALLKNPTFLYSFLCSLSLAFVSLPLAYGQQSTQQSVDLKKVTSLQAEVRMSAGTLELSSQREPQAAMQFMYTRDAWAPDVQLESASGRGELTIMQAEGKSFDMDDEDENSWKIKLPASIPTNLSVRIGAGEGKIDLHGAMLDRLRMDAGAGEFNVNLANSSVSDLEINAGVGSLTLDLRGKRSTNLDASINGGIGDIKLLLPKEVGVRVKVFGLGGLDSPGFTKEDGYYVNEAYGKTPYSMDIKINGGLGSLEMALHSTSH